MHKQFAQKLEDLRRLIENQRSASSVMSSGRSGSRRMPSGTRFLLAVSGGMDSMCLLDLFSKALPVSDYAVAHCNFSLRGEESDGDQALVEKRAAELGVQVFIRRFDTETYAREQGISIEMAARDLRYAWFADLCVEQGFDVIVVAHNANDNAETLMLNLLRGTGLNGLHGMSALVWNTPPVFRPLLEFTRKQIEGYVLVNHVPYRHDSSNFSSDYKRNKIRNEVFPVFERINPSFVRTLNREIEYFAEAGSIVGDWCRAQLPSVISSECNETEHLKIDTVSLLANTHWRYLLYYILEPYGFNSQTLASIESLVLSSRTFSGKRFESATHVLLTTQDSLLIVPREDDSVVYEQECAVNPDSIMVVRGPGIYHFNGRQFKVEIVGWTSDMSLRQPDGVLVMDADKIKFPFVCRRWRQGDWLVPLGMRGKKKVSDLFTDLKYNALEKDSAILMVDTLADDRAELQHVAGLLGVRIDDSYKVTSATTSVIRISL